MLRGEDADNNHWRRIRPPYCRRHGLWGGAEWPLIAYGQAALVAKTIWAGVTNGNAKSEAVLARLGFQAVSDQGTYTRFNLPLT